MSSESTVDIMAASTTTRKMPVKNAGKSSVLTTGKIGLRVVQTGEEHPAGHAGEDRPHVEADDADDRDQAPADDFVLIPGRDEASEELGGAEESQSDPQEPEDAGQPRSRKSETPKGLDEGRVGGAEGSGELGPSAGGRDSHDRKRHEATEHEDALQEITCRRQP